MANHTWYLGPSGALRALPVPEPGISTTVTRYGGVHQGLSGRRVMDITGHRSDYSFSWVRLREADWAWMEALHLRTIPGPFYLVNPLRRNLLSTSAVEYEAISALDSAHAVSSIPVSIPEIPTLRKGHRLLGMGTLGAYFRLEDYRRTPLFDGHRQVTFSAYARADIDTNVMLALDHFETPNSDDVVRALGNNHTITNEWTRLTYSIELAASVVDVRPFLYFPGTTEPKPPVEFAGFQVEYGLTATEWQPGGACPKVLVDQLNSSSPVFGEQDYTLTLMEA